MWISIDGRRTFAPLRSRAKEGVAPLVILSSPAVPAVCLSAGCASPLSFEPAPTPLAAAVLASFGLPLWALAGHREVGRPRRRSPYSIEPVSLGSSSPAALAIGLNHIEFRCNATSARCPVRTRTADLPIAPGGPILAWLLRHDDASLRPRVEVYPATRPPLYGMSIRGGVDTGLSSTSNVGYQRGAGVGLG